MKLSQWHDGSVKPVHVGVYERINIGYLGKYSYWDGKIWTAGFSDNIISIINHSKKYESFNQNLKWRGIVKDKK